MGGRRFRFQPAMSPMAPSRSTRPGGSTPSLRATATKGSHAGVSTAVATAGHSDRMQQTPSPVPTALPAQQGRSFPCHLTTVMGSKSGIWCHPRPGRRPMCGSSRTRCESRRFQGTTFCGGAGMFPFSCSSCFFKTHPTSSLPSLTLSMGHRQCYILRSISFRCRVVTIVSLISTVCLKTSHHTRMWFLLGCGCDVRTHDL